MTKNEIMARWESGAMPPTTFQEWLEKRSGFDTRAIAHFINETIGVPPDGIRIPDLTDPANWASMPERQKRDIIAEISKLMGRERVCVVWSDGNELLALSYWNGKVRTYESDKVDGRVPPGPLVDSQEKLWSQLNSGAFCRVPVSVARDVFGWSKYKFA